MQKLGVCIILCASLMDVIKIFYILQLSGRSPYTISIIRLPYFCMFFYVLELYNIYKRYN